MNENDIKVGDRVKITKTSPFGRGEVIDGMFGTVEETGRGCFHVRVEDPDFSPPVVLVSEVAPAVKVGDKVTIEDVGIYGCADMLVGKNATVTEVINNYNWWGTRVPGVTYVVRPEGTSYSGIARCVAVEKVEPAPKTGSSLGTATITIVPEIDEAALAQIAERIREAARVPAEPTVAEAKAATDKGRYIGDIWVVRDDNDDEDVVEVGYSYLKTHEVDDLIAFLRNCQRVHSAKTDPTPF